MNAVNAPVECGSQAGPLRASSMLSLSICGTRAQAPDSVASATLSSQPHPRSQAPGGAHTSAGGFTSVMAEWAAKQACR